MDSSYEGNSAILYASEEGLINIVKQLLSDPRVDPSVDNNSAILWASQEKHIDVVKLLLADERVRSSLSKKNLKKYEKLIE